MAHAGARNPKTASFTVRVDATVNERVEALSDKAGQNKATMAAMCIAAGLNILEGAFMVGLERYADQAAADKVAQLAADVVASAPPGLIQK